MDFSGRRIQIVFGLEGRLTDTWLAAWRDYEWDANDDLRPEFRITEQGPEVWFDWEDGCLESDLFAVATAVEACSLGLRNADAVEERQQAD